MLGSTPPGALTLGAGRVLPRIDLPTFVRLDPQTTAVALGTQTTAATLDSQTTEVVIDG